MVFVKPLELYRVSWCFPRIFMVFYRSVKGFFAGVESCVDRAPLQGFLAFVFNGPLGNRHLKANRAA